MPVRSRRPSRRSASAVASVLVLLLVPQSAQALTPDRTVTATPTAPATWAGPVASGQNQEFDPATAQP